MNKIEEVTTLRLFEKEVIICPVKPCTTPELEALQEKREKISQRTKKRGVENQLALTQCLWSVAIAEVGSYSVVCGVN